VLRWVVCLSGCAAQSSRSLPSSITAFLVFFVPNNHHHSCILSFYLFHFLLLRFRSNPHSYHFVCLATSSWLFLLLISEALGQSSEAAAAEASSTTGHQQPPATTRRRLSCFAMSSHPYSPYDRQSPSRPRPPSYTGLPAQHDRAAHKPAPLTSGSPGDYTTLPYATSPAASYGRPPSISTSSLSSSSYAGSAEDESLGSREVDMVEMLTQRLAGAFDPLQLDRSLAVQAQTYAGCILKLFRIVC
jgi:hypothetical protein